MRAKKILSIGVVCAVVVSLAGCEAFVRKFTRKPKTEAPAEELVLTPEAYAGPQMTKEELYRQHYLYWKNWQDELINAISSLKSQKKQLDCAQEALKNLNEMRAMLAPDNQKELDVSIGRLIDLQEAIRRDPYGFNGAAHSLQAERLRRTIMRDFSYGKIKGDLA